MADLTLPGAAVSGLLMERARHPYDIHQTMFERRDDQLLKVRPGTLFSMVWRWVSQGLIFVVGTDREGNRPERTSYAIGPSGCTASRQHLCVLLRTVANEYPGFLRGIAEVHEPPAAEVLTLLCRRLVALVEEVAELEAVRRRYAPEQCIYSLHLEYAGLMRCIEHAWICGLVDDIGSGRIDWSAPYSSAGFASGPLSTG